MKVAIHQPNYLPWAGFFHKMALADVFVILDTAQFTKNGYQNRVGIKTPKGTEWLTQPVKLSDGAFKPTREVTFADALWRKKHIKTLQVNYARADYFKDYFSDLSAIITAADESLCDCNIALIRWIALVMDIRVPVVLASSCPSSLTRTERLVELVRWAGGTTYLSGRGGMKYQSMEVFEEAGIRVDLVSFETTPYRQLWGDFVPGLSVVDLLFNCGPGGRKLVLEK